MSNDENSTTSSYILLSPPINERSYSGDYVPPCKHIRHPLLDTVPDPLDISSENILQCASNKIADIHSICNLSTLYREKQPDGVEYPSSFIHSYDSDIKEINANRGGYWVKNEENNKKPLKVCIYDLNRIDNIKQAQEYVQIFGNRNATADEIFSKICSMTTTEGCPDDPKTGKPMPKCMLLRDTREHGNVCRDWAEKADKKLVNKLKYNWCYKEENRNTNDCKCLARAFDKEFQDISGSFQGYDAACWYTPCNDSSPYLKLDEDHHCSLNICQTVFDLRNNRDVKLDNVYSNINCTFIEHPVTSEPDRNVIKDEETKNIPIPLVKNIIKENLPSPKYKSEKNVQPTVIKDTVWSFNNFLLLCSGLLIFLFYLN